MNALFVTWAGGGNSTPVLGLGTRLMRRGHQVRVVSPDDATERFASVNLDYKVLAVASGAVLAAIEKMRPDLVVVDFMMPAWLSEAEATSVPAVALVHTLYDRVRAGILTAFTSLEAINAHRSDLGLDEVATPLAILHRMACVLVTAPRELDTEEPTNGRHVGAILEEPGSDVEWLPPPSKRPLVAVSIGTTLGLDDDVLLPRVLEALGPLDVDVVANAGPGIDVASIEVPQNAVVQGYVRHAALLPHADAMVTHAGLGTICAALSFGLPMVCIPLGRDQAHNAERVEAVGAGIVLAPDAPLSDISAAVESVRTDASYRAAGKPFARAYDPAATAAISELEALAPPSRP